MYKTIIKKQMFDILLEDHLNMFIYNYGTGTRYLNIDELKNIIRVAQNTLDFFEENEITNDLIEQINDERQEDCLEELYQSVEYENNEKPKECGKEVYIYLAQNTKTKSYKIGFSTNVKSRIKTLNTSSEYKIILVDYFKGKVQDESDLHEKLKKYRKNSEWFENNKFVIKEFKSYKL